MFLKNVSIAPAYESRYNSREKECIGIFIESQQLYVIISALDRNGLNKLSTLKAILAVVFLGGLLLTSFLSFIFVRHAFSPLAKLSSQMKRTTELNLSERIDEGNGKTELNRIARNFNAMLQRLNEAFESQKSFVHHASHELRTPLATMLSQTEAALRKDLSKEEYKNVLVSLKEDQVGLIDLTNSLLLLSQYEKIQSANKWPPVRIDEVLYDTISNARKMLPFVNIDLQFANVPDDEQDLIVKGNEALLRVAFTNLIKNAWQYSVDREVIVLIEIIDQFINVHFDNKGEHLSESEIEKLKVPFFRGSNAANVKGFGLGLSIVERIMLLHHGNFEYTMLNPNINRFTAQFINKEIIK
jgi:signal transduction histidine kinase